jgi:hypothetical protein
MTEENGFAGVYRDIFNRLSGYYKNYPGKNILDFE